MKTKFRAWVKNTYMAIQGTPDIETLQSFMFHYGDEENIMESTCLFDKNGVEIFEGDVLEFKNNLGKHNLHKVFWEAGGLVINSHNDDFYKDYTPFFEACADMQTSGYIKQCEVIGNIYENPELLTK